MLGEAAPRDESEAIKVAVPIPGQPDAEITVRRGFVGIIPLVETGSSATYEGRQTVSVEFIGWAGDTPRFEVRADPAGPR